MRVFLALIVAMVSLTASSAAAAEPRSRIHRADHALVEYTGLEPSQAQAIATVVQATRQVAIERYGFDMPTTIHVRVHSQPGNKVRLFNDGHDRLDLSLRSPDQLRPPNESGIFHLYGLCHEVGHLAMYRAIPRHGWLNSDGAEGWAHFIGSEMVDGVYEVHGASAWCYPYEYLADGTARLDAQLAEDEPGDVAQAAAMWRELVRIIGPDHIAPLFTAWGKAQIDPVDPGAELRRILLDLNDDEQLADWWNRAEPMMIQVQPRSGFKARTAKPTSLMRQPRELKIDNGQPAGKRSIAGGGHAVTLTAPGPGWYLTQVRIFGSRYGHPRPPKEDFSVWLCDKDGQVIREFKFPYRRFARGNPKWLALPCEPTEVPPRFTICVGFNPTGTKGVFVHHDSATADSEGERDGASRTGLPGRLGDAMSEGNWMIRAVIDQRKDADSLRE